MQLHLQVFPILIENYGMTLVQWKMDIDTEKFESILQEIVRYSNNKREENLLVVLATTFQRVSPRLQVKYTSFPMMKRYGISLEDQQLQQSLLCVLITLNQRHKTGQNKKMMS